MRPQPLEPAECKNFAELLCCHLLRGTRPSGTRTSKDVAWDEEDLLGKIQKNPKALSNWKNGIYTPSGTHQSALERCFFGANSDYDEWLTQFRQLWLQARQRRKATEPIGEAAKRAKVTYNCPAIPEAHLPPKSRRCFIDIDRLPSTSFKRVIGRNVELDLLDSAFVADSCTQIQSIVAWGGSGKTALLKAWLQRIRVLSYSNADAVLCWSFYRQGLESTNASSDDFFTWIITCLNIKNKSKDLSEIVNNLILRLQQMRILLILDGVEVLQYGPGPKIGQLKDLGLRLLLRRHAVLPPQDNNSLILLTSRLAIKDLADFEGSGSAALLHLKPLPLEAGAQILRDNGVYGVGPMGEQDLLNAVKEFGGHALSLILLAAFLRDIFGGDIRNRNKITSLTHEDAILDDELIHNHARRVMHSIQHQWLDGEPRFLAIMEIVSLFDRPATIDCVAALRARGGIPGLSDVLDGIQNEDWSIAVIRLRRANLLSPPNEGGEDTLDTHALIRDWFGQGLRKRNEDAWRCGHARLYDHLQMTIEGEQPTREALEPLYRAIVHGCRANLFKSAFIDVYTNRICRPNPIYAIDNYASQILGLQNQNSAALLNFVFDPSIFMQTQPDEELLGRIYNELAICLIEVGLLEEAKVAQFRSARIYRHKDNWAQRSISKYYEAKILSISGHRTLSIMTMEKAHELCKRAINVNLRFEIGLELLNAYQMTGDLDRGDTIYTELIQLLPHYRKSKLSGEHDNFALRTPQISPRLKSAISYGEVWVKSYLLHDASTFKYLISLEVNSATPLLEALEYIAICRATFATLIGEHSD